MNFYRWREVSTSKLSGSLVSVECNERLSVAWKSSLLPGPRWRGCWTGTSFWGKENLGGRSQDSVEVIVPLGSDKSFTTSLFSLNLSSCLNLSCRSAIDEPATLGSLFWLPMKKERDLVILVMTSSMVSKYYWALEVSRGCAWRCIEKNGLMWTEIQEENVGKQAVF